jgi:parvulin-like peptidyl-prolyl isomerase
MHDFFSRYPKKQWERTDSLQKEKMLNDFIDRELCVLEAKNLGLHNDPVTSVKIYNRSLQALVNESYEYFVARPLLPEEELALARKNAKRELFINHVLIGHSESYLGLPPKRTVDEALVLCQQIKQDYDDGENFTVLAEKYSDDPGVKENSGTVGWVSWGTTVAAFQSVAFSLEVGNLSSPVLTDFGYHLILVSDARPSDYQYMSDDEYESLVVNITKNSIRDKLRPAALEYDKNMIDAHGVVFNMDAINDIVLLYVRQQKKVDFFGEPQSVSFLESMSPPIVVCVYNNKGYGPLWFARKLENTPLSRMPNFDSVDAVLSVFKTYLLQTIAIKKGQDAAVDTLFSYRQKVNDMISSLLYDAYLKHLVNIAPHPDSLSIRKYYQDNKLESYMEDERVAVREIRVSSRDLADSLLQEIFSGADFSSLAEKHSLVSADSGGLSGPFSRKQGAKYFDAVSLLEAGGISPVLFSSNSSFSIVQLVERFPSEPLGLEGVYSSIESLLFKENQDRSKLLGIDELSNKYIVTKKPFLLYK